MAELADAYDSKSYEVKLMWVRFPPTAPRTIRQVAGHKISKYMGFKLNINFILRQNIEDIESGKEYSFEKKSCVITDDIPIWLCKKDWTALAEIQITSQKRKANKTSGTFVIKHIYGKAEQEALTNIFRRMYGWK